MTTPSDTSAHAHGFLPLHRVEALTDGIFAVAMTLLVIELKLPADHSIHSLADLYGALGELAPKAWAWANSFFVLALFWIGHHRVFGYVRRADAKLVVLNLLELAFISLMPFVAMLEGEYGAYLVSQVFYAGNMALLSLVAMLIGRHVHHHSELCSHPMPAGMYRGGRFRLIGLLVISFVSLVIAAFVPWPSAGNMAFVLMAVIGPMSRRIEKQADARVLQAAAA